uniref:Uncharacterized protein n=1 Tax=Thermofilum pendens TaxID=2269 RepID=A0A7C4BAQ7_THEPE
MPKRRRYDAFARGFTVEELSNSPEKVVEELLEIAILVREGGYQGFLPTLVLEEWSAKLRSAARALWEACLSVQNIHGLKCYPRCHVRVNRVGTAKNIVQEVRRACVILSVEAMARELYTFACRDRRVDIVTAGMRLLQPPQKGVIRYAQLRGKFFELIVGYLLEVGDVDSTASMLAGYRELASLAFRKGIPLILSAGPRKSYSPYSFRELLSFADAVLGVPAAYVAKAMGDLLDMRILENLEKISGKRPAEGVYVEG